MATNDRLYVDVEALRSLAVKLMGEGDEIDKLLQSTSADVKALDTTWAGANHDKFNEYFDELYDNVMEFHPYVRFFGEILRDAVKVYEKLMDDVDAKMSTALDACN